MSDEDEKPEGKVVIAVYRKTRKRINVFAAMKGMKQVDYMDSVIPDLKVDGHGKLE